jgi:hypothetical protein
VKLAHPDGSYSFVTQQVLPLKEHLRAFGEKIEAQISDIKCEHGSKPEVIADFDYQSNSIIIQICGHCPSHQKMVAGVKLQDKIPFVFNVSMDFPVTQFFDPSQPS